MGAGFSATPDTPDGNDISPEPRLILPSVIDNGCQYCHSRGVVRFDHTTETHYDALKIYLGGVTTPRIPEGRWGLCTTRNVMTQIDQNGFCVYCFMKNTKHLVMKTSTCKDCGLIVLNNGPRFCSNCGYSFVETSE